MFASNAGENRGKEGQQKKALEWDLRRGMTIRLENISCDVDNDSDEANKSWKEFYLNKRAALPSFLLPKVE